MVHLQNLDYFIKNGATERFQNVSDCGVYVWPIKGQLLWVSLAPPGTCANLFLAAAAAWRRKHFFKWRNK